MSKAVKTILEMWFLPVIVMNIHSTKLLCFFYLIIFVNEHKEQMMTDYSWKWYCTIDKFMYIAIPIVSGIDVVNVSCYYLFS